MNVKGVRKHCCCKLCRSPTFWQHFEMKLCQHRISHLSFFSHSTSSSSPFHHSVVPPSSASFLPLSSPSMWCWVAWILVSSSLWNRGRRVDGWAGGKWVWMEGGWREGVKEVNNNHHRAANPLEADGWGEKNWAGRGNGWRMVLAVSLSLPCAGVNLCLLINFLFFFCLCAS